MRVRGKMIERCVVRILCVIALVFVGFAHQVPVRASTDVSPADFAEYVLPDSTLPTLCVTVSEGSEKGQHDKAHSQGCEACRISSSILLPVPADLHGNHVRFVVAPVLPVRTGTLYRRLFTPNTAPRAPPSNPIVV